ncbi:RHS repeat-associated core domain-containing protein [Actinoplanes sp. NPDC051346]|uniref:RHS repeat-associated core domain-containing protein n=1 Tax=Actinoplanes sp. NPDC051346 TaxID=3155048 RepID=UPI00344000A2
MVETVVVGPSTASAGVPQLPSAPGKPATQVLERPDEAAALVTARMTQQSVRIGGLTTETAEYFARPDGQIEAKVSAGPVRTMQGGKWVPIDLTLQLAEDGSVRPVADVLGLQISGARTGSGDLASVGSGGRRLALGWTGKLPTPVLDGNRAKYRDVAPGVDLVVEATRSGFEQFVIVKSRDAVDHLPSLSFPLTGKNLAALKQDRSGGLALRDAKGALLGTVPAPEMWDARRATGTEVPLHRKVVTAKGELASATKERHKRAATSGKQDLTLALQPDVKWLKDPATQYPVTIDPQINALLTSFDTYVREDVAADRSGAADLQLGTFTGTPNAKARAFAHWPVAAFAGKEITEATVNFWSFWSNTCAPSSWEIWTTEAASSASRWDSQPAWLNREASSTASKGYSAACDDGWVTIDGRSFFQRAATAGQSTAYMGVRATDESTTLGSKIFRSRNAVDSAQVPSATITYHSYAEVGTRSTVPASACETGTDRPQINTATPQLRAVVSDAEAAPVKAEFEWWSLTGSSRIGGAITDSSPSGSTMETTVPAGTLANGVSYRWRVRGNDGNADGPWSSFCEFSVDTSVGSAPVVTSVIYPENGWGGEANQASDFTFSANGIKDAAAYEYSLDVQPVNRVVNTASSGASATVKIMPTTPGWHVVFARTRDAAGNVSALRSYPFKVGSTVLTSPRTGDVSGAKTSIAATTSPSYTNVTYQWRRAGSDTWREIPAAHVTYAAGGGAVTWPVPVTDGSVAKVNWDIAATLAAIDAQGVPRDGPVQLRGLFNGVGSDPVKLTFDRDMASAATSPIGPGTVNLITGNYEISQPDVSVGSFAVSRTVNSRQPLGLDPLFGPGWVSGMSASDAAMPFTGLTVYGSLAQAKLPDGSSIGFTRTSGAGTSFEPQIGAETYTLTANAAGTVYTLKNGSGETVTFTRGSTDPAGVYSLDSVSTSGSGTTTTYSWEKATVGSKEIMRPTRVLAPTADGVSCTSLVRGCKALVFTYASATTATGKADGTWGDYAGRVSQIAYTAWDPDLATPAMRSVVVARYTYDDSGRLRSQWDPRLDWTNAEGNHSLRHTYFYDANGILVTMTPPAQEPWHFAYTTVPNDSGAGRLAKVTRSALSAGATVETVAYRVPIAGNGAPYDMSVAQTKRWGQSEQPIDATAVFPASQVPSGDQAAGAMPNSYERAMVTYLDANARIVNVAQPGGHLNTVWYDDSGQELRTLTAENRKRALNAAASDTAEVEAERAASLSDANVYSADGERLLETFGPEHDVTLPGSGTTVRGREHHRFTYDEGAPETDIPFNLVTTERKSVSYVKDGRTVDEDVDTASFKYDWKLRSPINATADPDGLDMSSRASYDSAGRTTAATTPAGGGSDNTPATQKIVYYTNADNATAAECGNRSEWAGLACRTEPGNAAESGPELLVTTTTYDLYGQPRVATEKNSKGVQRVTTTSYDKSGRPIEQTVTATTGKALDKSRSVYDPASGQLLRSQTVNSSNAVTAEIVRAYDALGRVTSYTDADGNTSTTTYDILGRVASSSDGKATRTYGYDGGYERRGLATSVNDSKAGTFTADYNADGALVSESWSSGVVVTHSHDEAGVQTKRTYTRPNCGRPDCVLYFDNAGFNVHGQKKWDSSTLARRSYDYDAAGRLTHVADTIGGSCTSRVYGFDEGSNRTSLQTYLPGAGGVCQKSTGAQTRNWQFDNAARVTGGYVYDTFGRTTTVPAADSTGAGGNATVSYHVNDLVSTINQNGRTTAYTLDVNNIRIRSWTDNRTGTQVRATNHYNDDTDSPIWTQETPTEYTRTVAGLHGAAGSYHSADGQIRWTISNLHGDFVATIVGQDTGLSSTSETDEYGQPYATAQVGTQRYGYLGSYQRAADAPVGLTLMGVRLYNPTTGRFLQKDPVFGGGANPYSYPTDPINMQDTSGMFWGGFGEAARAGILATVMKTLELGSMMLCAGTVSAYKVCAAVTGGALGFLDDVLDQWYVSKTPFGQINWLKAAVKGMVTAAYSVLGAWLFKKFEKQIIAKSKSILGWLGGRIRSRWPAVAGALASITGGVISAIQSKARKS